MPDGIEGDETIGLFLVGGVGLIIISEFIKTQLTILKENLINDFYAIINNYFIHLTLFFLLGIFISYVCYATYRNISKKNKEREERLNKIEGERKYVNEFLKENLNSFSYEELKLRLNEVKKISSFGAHSGLISKINEAKNVLIKTKHKEELEEIINRKAVAKEEVEDLELKIEELKKSDTQKKNSLKYELEMDENKVFDKSNLTEKEIEILLEEGYKQVNEYCVFQKKIITVLIRPTLNHSVAHVFLVWSTRQLLESYFEIERIVEHDTRDADLTFRVGNKLFAIEIETGTLFRKKDQFKKKIKNLNCKYKNRWLIIVSKRELTKKYSPFGPCTQRKWVCEKLEKMAKI
jgi:hypothetical protein